MTRLVLHIGDCKAGSTAIQSVLRDETYSLSGADQPTLLYARAGRRKGLNHQRLSNSLHLEHAAKWREKAWQALHDEIAETKPDIAIVSSERFEFTDPNTVRKQINSLFEPGEIDLHIICYVRPHLQRLLSGYAQNLKQGIFDEDISAFMSSMEREGRFRYAPRLLQWASVFEDATVSIKPLIRSELVDGCVVSDCLNQALAGFDTVATVDSIPVANESLSLPALDFIRQLWTEAGPRSAPGYKQKAAALTEFCQALEREPVFDGPKLMLSAAENEAAAALYATDARDCDVKVFQRPVMVPALQADAKKQGEKTPTATGDVDCLTISRIWLEVLATVLARRSNRQSPRSSTAHTWASVERDKD